MTEKVCAENSNTHCARGAKHKRWILLMLVCRRISQPTCLLLLPATRSLCSGRILELQVKMKSACPSLARLSRYLRLLLVEAQIMMLYVVVVADKSTMQLEDALHKCPRLWEVMSPVCLGNLVATNRSIRRKVHEITTGITITDDLNVKMLVKTIRLPRLKRLSIWGEGITCAQARQFAQGILPGLESLRIVAPAQLDLLLKHLSCPLLQDLDLSRNDMDEGAVASLAHIHCPMLTHVELSQGIEGPAAIAHLAGCNWPQLTMLDLSHNPACSKGLQSLAKADWPLLSDLNLINCAVEDDHEGLEADWPVSVDASITESVPVSFLVQASFPRLSTLLLDKNRLSTLSISCLSQGCWPCLRHLSLRDNNLDDAAIERLIAADMPTLEHLDLFCNSLDNLAVAQLVKCKFPYLQVLELGRNLFGGDAMRLLNTGKWPMLKRLGVADLLWTSAATIALFRGNWPLLETLDVSGKFLPEEVSILLFGHVTVGQRCLVEEGQPVTDGQSSLSEFPVRLYWPNLQSISPTVRVRPSYRGVRVTVKCV